MGVGLAPPQRALALERSDDGSLSLGDGEAGEGLTRLLGHAPVLADHAVLLEAMTAPDLEVVGVVAGRDLERAAAEVGLDVVVGDHRQAPADERQHDLGADEVRVALVGATTSSPEPSRSG